MRWAFVCRLLNDHKWERMQTHEEAYGVELLITRVEAKRKLSQNRPDADIDGVIAGLRGKGELDSADDVERAQQDPVRRS